MSSDLTKKKSYGLAVISTVAALLAALGIIFEPAAIRDLESRTWDSRVAYAARYLAPDPRIKLVVIDQKSLDLAASEGGNFWIWPRDIYEPVIAFLRRAGVRGVAFDLLFSEQSSYGVKVDQIFAEAVAGEPPVVLAAAARPTQDTFNEQALEKFLELQTAEDRVRNVGQRFLTHPKITKAETATVPTFEILSRARYFGSVTGQPDPDGVFRHTRPGAWVRMTPLLSLPFALYEATTEAREPAGWLREFQDAEGRLAIRFKGGESAYEMYSIYSVIQSFLDLEEGKEPSIPLETFRDGYVFVGTTAPGLLDLRANPMSANASGVEFNAAVLDNILHRDFIQKVPAFVAVIVTTLLIVSMALLTIFTQEVRTHALIFILYTGGFLLIGLLLAVYGWWMPIVAPAFGLTLAALASNGFQFYLEGRQHRFIKGAFKQYVSPSVIDQIVANPSVLTLGGERRELTMFFSDIQGFTSISEALEADKLVGLINTFLTAMTRVILEHGGTVDKYVGDAIVAFWNAPLTQDDHALRAVNAALECQRRLQALQPEFKERYGVEVRMRIGLNTGVVGVGNFGSEERFNYTMIGDAANLASRLEGANKSFGTYILMSQSTRDALHGAVPNRRIAELRVIGKDEVIPVYEPLEGAADTLRKTIQAFDHARKLFEAGRLEDAARAFAQLGDDPVAVKYLKRIGAERERNVPGGQWSPVWNMTEK